MGVMENGSDDFGAKAGRQPCPFAFGSDRAFHRVVAQHFGSDLSEQGEVLRTGAVAHLVVILMVGHIQVDAGCGKSGRLWATAPPAVWLLDRRVRGSVC